MFKLTVLVYGIWMLTLGQGEVSFTRDVVTWSDAASGCEGKGAVLVMPSYQVVSAISTLKRSAHLHMGDTAWVGIYSSVRPTDVLQGNYTNIWCSTIQITDIIPMRGAFIYTYRVKLTSCSLQNMAICLSVNSLGKYTARRSRKAAFRNCQENSAVLWTPNITVITDGDVYSIGRGHIELKSTSTTPYLEVGDTYWVHQTYVEEKHVLPMSNHRFRCGFLSYTSPNVGLDDCSTRRGFICSRADMVTNDSYSTSTSFAVSLQETKVTTSAGELWNGTQTATGTKQWTHAVSITVYVSVSVAAVVVIVIIIMAVLLWRRKAQVSALTNKSPDEVVMRNSTNESTTPNMGAEEYRVTTYEKINPAHVTGDHNFMSSGDTNPVIPEETSDTEYAVIMTPKAKRNAPDVVPTSVSTEYLPMNNHGNANTRHVQADCSYDTTESFKLKHQCTGSDTGHTYSCRRTTNLTNGGVADMTYDSTLERHSSRKYLIDNYDHVDLSRDGDICHSIEIGGNEYCSTTSSTRRVFNPVYDRVETK